MSNSSDVEKAAGCFLIFLSLACIPVLILIDSWMLWCGYYWAVLPVFVGLPEMTFRHAVCLTLMKGMLTTHHMQKNEDEEILQTALRIWMNMIWWTIFDLILLGALYVVH